MELSIYNIVTKAGGTGWDSGSDSQNNIAKLAHPRISYLCRTQEARQSGGCYHDSRYQEHSPLAVIQ